MDSFLDYMDPSFVLKGCELGKLVWSSGLLQSSWSKVSKINELTYSDQDSDLQLYQKKKRNDSALRIKIFKEAKCTFVVLAAPPICEISSSSSASTLLDGSQEQNPFNFLCSEKISSFSVYTPAFELFSSAYDDLSKLKSKLLLSKKPVIITGTALGGSVASLFTLWLLETLNPKLKRPLCITFGSPLIVDAYLQHILEDSVRESCFLHVADSTQSPIMAGFKPFGTFLICFDSGCICIKDPEAVMELLIGANTDLVDYGEVLHRLDQSVLSMADPTLIPDDVLVRMEDRAWEKNRHYDPVKKLKNMKILMMYIELYKKSCKKVKICYYDEYRSNTSAVLKVEDWKNEVDYCWKALVEEEENKAQNDILIHRGLFLISGVGHGFGGPNPLLL